jgi:hypothetical protein
VTVSFVPAGNGVCTAIMKRPKWARPLPATPELLKYSEQP